MKKRSSLKNFKTSVAMDKHLEKSDLGEIFQKRGVLKKPNFKKVNLDLPEAVVEEIDRIAIKIGVSRQPLLKMWIHEKLKEEEAA